MNRRKVIIGRNEYTQQLYVYSNRKKVYAEHQRRLTMTYNQFCIHLKKGVTIQIPQGMGISDPVVFREYAIQ